MLTSLPVQENEEIIKKFKKALENEWTVFINFKKEGYLIGTINKKGTDILGKGTICFLDGIVLDLNLCSEEIEDITKVGICEAGSGRIKFFEEEIKIN